MSREPDASKVTRPTLTPPITEADVAALLNRGASPSVKQEQAEFGKGAPAPRSRRPRETIALSDEEMRTLSSDEIRKRKNAVAAQRARDHKEQRTRDLEDMVRDLWSRVLYLEAVIQTLHPNESLDNLYNRYEPYTVSETTSPLGGLQTTSDMRELQYK
ncbi:hypothetical protein BBJ28_00009681 [Nothophytophthora sp. Chile5]|nr:hypothetical protein BBJ28_00009681 [Nothophytophthora sp. Chile5]